MNVLYNLSKETTRFLAPFAALNSIAAEESTVLGHLKAIYQVPTKIYDAGISTLNHTANYLVSPDNVADLSEIVSNASQNLQENLEMTALMSVGIYTGLRLIPKTVKGLSLAGSKLKGKPKTKKIEDHL